MRVFTFFMALTLMCFCVPSLLASECGGDDGPFSAKSLPLNPGEIERTVLEFCESSIEFSKKFMLDRLLMKTSSPTEAGKLSLNLLRIIGDYEEQLKKLLDLYGRPVLDIFLKGILNEISPFRRSVFFELLRDSKLSDNATNQVLFHELKKTWQTALVSRHSKMQANHKLTDVEVNYASSWSDNQVRFGVTQIYTIELMNALAENSQSDEARTLFFMTMLKDLSASSVDIFFKEAIEPIIKKSILKSTSPSALVFTRAHLEAQMNALDSGVMVSEDYFEGLLDILTAHIEGNYFGHGLEKQIRRSRDLARKYTQKALESGKFETHHRPVVFLLLKHMDAFGIRWQWQRGETIDALEELDQMIPKQAYELIEGEKIMRIFVNFSAIRIAKLPELADKTQSLYLRWFDYTLDAWEAQHTFNIGKIKSADYNRVGALFEVGQELQLRLDQPLRKAIDRASKIEWPLQLEMMLENIRSGS